MAVTAATTAATFLFFSSTRRAFGSSGGGVSVRVNLFCVLFFYSFIWQAHANQIKKQQRNTLTPSIDLPPCGHILNTQCF